MGIKRVIATILNIQDGKPAAEGNFDYLKEALTKGSTTTEGGLILSNVLAVKRTDGSVASYINGLAGNPVAIAAGVQNFGLANETKKIALNHDGSGYLASGKINWDVQGNAVIGGFYILSDRLSSSPTGTGKRHDIVSATTGQAYDEWYDENDVLVAREGFIEGKQQKVWYDINGNKTAAIGQNGVISYLIPESYTLSYMGNLSIVNAPNTATLSQADIQNIKDELSSYFSPKAGSNLVYLFSFPVSNVYYYNAGSNISSDSNRVYEGYKSTQNKTDNVPNGWYLTDIVSEYLARKRYDANEYHVKMYMVYINAGKAGSSYLLEVTVG